MDANSQQFFRNLIHHEMAQLLGYQAKTMMEMLVSDDRLSDMIDYSAIQSERNFELIIRDRERRLIEKMMEAIQRIDEGTYGTCDGCGEEITEKRLIARPVTTFCIKCKVKQEKTERLRGKGSSRVRQFDFDDTSLYHQESLSKIEEKFLP